MQTIDPITLEVARGYLVSTAFQMRATLTRTATWWSTSAATTAPLRAWVKVGADLPKEGVLLGPVGRRILKLTPGDEVWVRRLEVKAVAPA